MATVDKVVVELEARLNRYNGDVRAAAANFERSIGRQELSIKRLEQQVRSSSNSIGSQLRGLAGTIAAGFSAQQVAKMSDSYTRFTNQLRVAGLEGKTLAETQERLFGIAQQNGVELEAVGTLYSRAAQNQKELGASTEDLLSLTRAVSASLKISGTSTEEASGALLQLGQALGSPRIQAEEFNSLLDTMQPLLREAAKYIDGTGNSLSGLTRKIKDTNGEGVSNVEFFRAINLAMKDLESTAGSATATISGAFTNLSNALTKYVGEAGTANGTTASVTAAINLLAENLDTVANALAVIAVVGLARYTAGAITATGATVAHGIAAQQAAARQAFLDAMLQKTIATNAVYGSSMVRNTALMGTFGAMAGRAGAAISAAFGGPIGITLALGAAILYLVETQDNSTASSRAQGVALAQLQPVVDADSKAINDLAGATGKARDAAIEHIKALRAERLEMIASARAAAEAARAKVQAAKAELASRSTLVRGLSTLGIITGVTPAGAAGEGDVTAAQAEYDAQMAKVGGLIDSLDKLGASITAPTVGGIPAGAGKPEKPKRSPKSSSGPSAADIAARQADELARLNQEELRAKIDLTSDVEARGELERELLASERDQRFREIAENKGLSDAQKKAQRDIVERLYGRARAEGEGEEITVEANRSLYAQLQRRNEQRDALARALERTLAGLRAEDAMLLLQGDLADTLDDRRQIELQRLTTSQNIERAQLREEIAQAELAKDTERLAAARKALADFEARAPLEQRAVERRNANPIGRYNDSLKDPKTQVEEAVVRKLDAVTDGISDGLADFIGTDDPFIKSLIKILIEQVLIRPITEALESVDGGGGIGGILGSVVKGIGGLFRATGGPVKAGQFYNVNEGASPGRVEGFIPATGGQIVPLGQMDRLRAPAAASRPAIIQITADEGAAFVPRVQAISGDVSVQVVRQAAPSIVNGAVAETFRQSRRPRP